MFAATMVAKRRPEATSSVRWRFMDRSRRRQRAYSMRAARPTRMACGTMPVMASVRDRVLAEVDALADETAAFTTELVRIPTVNPPGDVYEDCARVIGDRLRAFGFEVQYIAAEGRPEHTAAHPRVNVMGVRAGEDRGPVVHFNGHFDVVPAGEGWTVDPFGGEVRDGKIWGRGTGDMKAGLAAAVYAVEALRRADVQTAGTLEVSGTVDEESGGFAGVAFLAET